MHVKLAVDQLQPRARQDDLRVVRGAQLLVELFKIWSKINTHAIGMFLTSVLH
jgi:hypothetical protein